MLRLASFDHPPGAPITARIAAGLTQRDLAERLGLKPQQIQRDEATDFAAASLGRVTAVIAALGIEVRMEIRLPERPRENA